MPSRIPSAPQGLPVDGDHPTSADHGAYPCPHPDDPHSNTAASRRARSRRIVDPLGDRRERSRAGIHRGQRHRHDHSQPVPAPTLRPRFGHPAEDLEKCRCRASVARPNPRINAAGWGGCAPVKNDGRHSRPGSFAPADSEESLLLAQPGHSLAIFTAAVAEAKVLAEVLSARKGYIDFASSPKILTGVRSRTYASDTFTSESPRPRSSLTARDTCGLQFASS